MKILGICLLNYIINKPIKIITNLSTPYYILISRIYSFSCFFFYFCFSPVCFNSSFEHSFLLNHPPYIKFTFESHSVAATEPASFPVMLFWWSWTQNLIANVEFSFSLVESTNEKGWSHYIRIKRIFIEKSWFLYINFFLVYMEKCFG